MTKTLQLHCPSNNKTVDDFVVSPFQTPEQVLQGIRLRLGINYAALYTIDAKHVTDPQSLQEDQRVLVAATAQERMLPDAPPGYVLYDGEEGEDVDPDVDGCGQLWEDLSDREKCEHIQSLVEQKPATRNRLRITRLYESVQDDLTALQSATQLCPADCEALIEQRWHTTVEHFLPDAVKPSKFRVAGKIWDVHVLLALSVLSSFTHGQSRLAQRFLEEAVASRLEEAMSADKDPVVQEQDVVNAITIIYEHAGIIPAKLTKPKSAKAKGKERRKALKELKKAEGKDRMCSMAS